MNASSPARRNGDKPFVISRLFTAPPQKVWRAWTDKAELQRWFGPAGMTMPVCNIDLRTGGVCHYCLRTADGHEMWGKWIFRQIVEPKSLILIQSFSDAQGNVTAHPMSPTWPRETWSETAFSPRDGGTLMEIRWTAINATETEHATFDAAHDGMRQGWGGTLDRLAEHLAKG